MKKILAILIAVVFFIGSFSIFSFAIVDHPIVDSVMVAPEVFYKIEDGKKKIQLATVYDDDYGYLPNHRYQLYLFYAEGNSNANFYMQQYGDYLQLCCDQLYSFKYDRYDILTGEFIDGNQGISGGPYSASSYIICNPPDRLYAKGVGSGASVLWYQILPDGLAYGGLYNGARNDTKLTNEFVRWAIVPPDPVVYRSYTSEPVSDPLNKYVILCGEEGSYLFWINIRCRDFEALSYSWDIETDDPNVSDFVTYNEYIKAQSLFTPRLTFDANGQSMLSLEADQQLLDYYLNMIPSAQSSTFGYIAFDCLITKYDLLTGQYISSTFNSDFRLESWTITIDATNFFGLAQDYDSISIYGVNYLNQSDEVLNRAAIIWGIDPSFESWKEEILSKLDDLYNLLSGQDVTIETAPNDTSAIDDAKNAADALKVTDASGNEIHPGEAAASGFAEAESAIADLQNPVREINTLINDWVFGINPLIYLPLIVGLALGLLVTIVGKNKSD